MRLLSLLVENFRAARRLEIALDGMTVLIGRNGAGKTTVLDALEWFAEDKKMSPDDFGKYFHEGAGDADGSGKISITATLGTVTAADCAGLGVHESFNVGGRITVRKEFEVAETATGRSIRSQYYARKRVHPDFAAFRGATGTSARTAYETLREGRPSLPKYGKRVDAEAAIQKWEDETFAANNYEGSVVEFHPADFEVEDVLDVTYVRASVQTVAERGGRDGPLQPSIDRAIFRYWKDARPEEYRKVERLLKEVVPDTFKASGYGADIQASINRHLNSLVDGSGFTMEFDFSQEFREPRSVVRLREGGRDTTADNVGQGMQRSLAISMLRALGEMAERSSGGPRARVIMIDEPELFQHPTQQRHLKDVLEGLSGKMQVVCSTHSPYFVSLKSFGGLRMILHGSRSHAPSVDRVLGRIRADEESNLDETTFVCWLDTNASRSLTEGFFARAVVLVEGPQDYASLSFMCDHVGGAGRLHSEDMTIIPCGGKDIMNRMAAVFEEFEIPCYLVWDSDCKPEDKDLKKHARENKTLLRCVKYDPSGLEDPDFPDLVESNFACFKTDMTSYIRAGSEGVGLDGSETSKKRIHQRDVLAKIVGSGEGRLPKLQEIARMILAMRAGKD